jgi:uncharacterized protein (UPF0303 family)
MTKFSGMRGSNMSNESYLNRQLKIVNRQFRLARRIRLKIHKLLQKEPLF